MFRSLRRYDAAGGDPGFIRGRPVMRMTSIRSSGNRNLHAPARPEPGAAGHLSVAAQCSNGTTVRVLIAPVKERLMSGGGFNASSIPHYLVVAIVTDRSRQRRGWRDLRRCARLARAASGADGHAHTVSFRRHSWGPDSGSEYGHATARPCRSSSGGAASAQSGCAMGQRVRNAQPDGFAIGEGGSPVSDARDAGRRSGSGRGTAASSDFVYGWTGRL